ncbi:MAG TPA: hypothetical protein PK671_22810, partial [Candidatus Obscuribacter sp.]|nr:hypothetical protein [Candidatus Obscuribacter sp.]
TVWNEGTSRFENCLMDYEKARLQESDGLIEVRNFAVLENLNQYFLKKKNSNGSVQEQKVCDRLYLFYQQTKDTQSKIMKIGLPPVKRTVNRAKSPSWNRISRRRQKWEENPNTALNSVIQRCS